MTVLAWAAFVWFVLALKISAIKGIIGIMLREKLNQVLASRKPFASDSLNRAGFFSATLVNIIHWGILYFKLNSGGANILLQYNVVYGPESIGPALYAYNLPAIALLILFVNVLVASSFYKKEKLPAYFLGFATLAVQLIFLAAGLVLI